MNSNAGAPSTVRSPEKPPTAVELDVSMASEGQRLPGIPKEYSGWDVYNNEAKKVDTELVNDWRDSLNSLLLFAAIFAAVLTAFIIESKKMLEPDQSEIMVDVMIFFTNNLANGNHTLYSRPQFQPSSSSITINCLFFASLSASLVAALASVVALQWVADYDAAITRGGSSPEDRAMRRQFRYAGVVWWRMSEIIAALPLLLYCSVIIFFGGLTLWMLSLHYIVGSVVAGGAGLAVLFYAVSTLLSIAFVSAPFRTPLGRWIYILNHALLSIIFLLARALQIPSIPPWLEQRHLTYTVSRKREDREVDKRSELAMDALVWLANHISISQDSYDRLLLLVGELPKLILGKSSSISLGDAPWFLIFDLLGWRNLKTDDDYSISNQETHSIRILSQLYRIPQVQEIITPIHPLFYQWDETEEEYWLQCCDKKTSQWSHKQHRRTPNSLFLLLRDVPLPSNNTGSELELTIWLSRWRNSVHTVPSHMWPHRNPIVASVPSDISVMSSRFLKADAVRSWFARDNRYLYDTIVARMLCSLVLTEASVPPILLDLLLAYSELLLVGQLTIGSSSHLSAPLLYSQAIYDSPMEYQDAHFAFTLMLARNLNIWSGSERLIRVKELITMLWAAPVYRGLVEPNNIARPAGMENFFDANKAMLMTWLYNANDIPYIREILEHLSIAQKAQPEIGPLWRVVTPQADTDSHFIGALVVFNRVLRHPDVTPAQHCALIDLICRDLEIGPPSAFRRPFSTSQLKQLKRIQDPCLRFLGWFIEGLNSKSFNLPLMETKGRWKESWGRIATHFMKNQQVSDPTVLIPCQALLWAALPDHGSRFCEEALKDAKTLVSSYNAHYTVTHEIQSQLCRVFEHPILCSEHYDGEGHLLLHIFDHMRTCDFPRDMKNFTAIPLKGRYIGVLPALLILSQGLDELPLQNLIIPIHEQCWAQILLLCRAVAVSRFALLALAADVCNQCIGERDICTEDLAVVLICIGKALNLPSDRRVDAIIQPLVSRVRQLEDTMVEIHNRAPEETKIVSNEVTRAINCLNDYLATTLVFGGQNCRVVSCARSREPFSPAVGWLAEYVD